ncbi:hypothetical protein ACFL1O_00895 [Patescibacteria group bacterium]
MKEKTEFQDLNSRKQGLINLAEEIIKVLEKIRSQTDSNQKENAENGRWEFAYVKYYLAEVSSLLNLSVYLLKHDIFRKYTYFPTRLIMEITLQLEHVYSVKKKKGLDGVRRLFFKDIATSAKSSLALPGEGGKDKIKNHLSLLDVASKILKLDFSTKDVSAKSKRDIKTLCDKSHIIVKQFTGSELYSFYEILSESSHANVVSIGASDSENDEIGSLNIFEIGIELSIRFCEMIINESKYGQLQADLDNIKKIAGID